MLKIFTLDTGRLNQETYDCMDAIRERYGVRVEDTLVVTDSGEPINLSAEIPKEVDEVEALRSAA